MTATARPRRSPPCPGRRTRPRVRIRQLRRSHSTGPMFLLSTFMPNRGTGQDRADPARRDRLDLGGQAAVHGDHPRCRHQPALEGVRAVNPGSVYNALKLAQERSFRPIAFPLIGAGSGVQSRAGEGDHGGRVPEVGRPDRSDPRVVQGELKSVTTGLMCPQDQGDTMGFSSRYVLPHLCDCPMVLSAFGRATQEGPGRRGRGDPGDRLRHRPEPGLLSRARPRDHDRRSQPRHEYEGPEADRQERHRGRSAEAGRRDSALRRRLLRPRGEHLEDVQHPRGRACAGAGLPRPEAGRSAVFLEHGLGVDPKVRAWQRRLNPTESLLGDGCRLGLDVEAVVRGQPSGRVEVEQFEMENSPRTHGTMHRGFGAR